MEPLDERTLTAVAALICGDDSQYYRRSKDLVEFFRRAGWAVPDDLGGASRRLWTVGVLRDHRGDTEGVARVLLRLADRREYPADDDTADEVRRRLNRLLAAENLHVAYGEDRRPRLCQGLDAAPVADELRSKKLLYSLEDIVTDASLLPLLVQRIDEFETCRASGCHLAAMILMGSLMEGLLLDAAESRPVPDEIWAEPAFRQKRIRKPDSSRDWTLHALIHVAYRLSWIDVDAYKIVEALRYFRNLVHANEQRAVIGDVPDADTVDMYWPAVIGAINDLGRTRPGRGGAGTRRNPGGENPWRKAGGAGSR
ncbi:hypothetical protein [Amycolatopsis sp. cmx-4-83]|uniref:hypothetical protein n=1 Tax=Amycolatopsis sp. cmx-4-83 TaxID=2790940 RepID=UPI00397A4D3D